ncbi:TM1802 family CRISPR-associated protein [Halococcus sp. AFM35]|uniref:TM1802 family CRISPR-associated protein n=1 Tax=Halococcus sp. AFM35 TaxID=3421653 RepID=UPI003EBED10C
MNSEALRELPDSEIEAALPDRPVTSVRDVESLYGKLYTLGRGFTGEYGPFLSPDAASELVGEERLVVVRVDLTGGAASLPEDPVRVVTYASEVSSPTRGGLVPDIEHVAHAKFEAARGVDHSITHLSGQTNTPEKHADHAIERFTRWPNEDAVLAEAGVHDDGELLDALDAFGENEDSMERIASAVKEQTEEGQFLHTVAFKLDADAVATTEQFDPAATWHLPGEIEVLQEAMVRRKTTKFRAKNEAEDASGDGVCYVEDTDEEVYGVVDDPLKWYLSKQMERFPRFDPDQSWRTQGLGREAAIAAQNATTFLDACAESGPGVSAFYFPYFEGELDAEDARELYATLAEQANELNDRNAVAALYDYIRSELPDSDVGDLRFVFMVVNKYQKDRWRLLAFEPNGTVHYGDELARKHHDAVNSSIFGEDGPLPIRENFDLLNTGRSSLEWLDTVTGVGYFAETCSPPDTDDEPSSDDFRFRATKKVVGGEGIEVHSLLAAYVDRIADRFDPDGEYPFPGTIIAEQHAQLTALANTGLLDARGDTDFTADTAMTESTTTDETEMNRTEQLKEFIDRHDALRGEESYERRAVFLLGALNGRITRQQRQDERGSTAVTTYPVENITKHNIKRTARELLTSNFVRTEEARKRDGIKVSGTLFAELVREIVDDMEREEPTGWDLTTDDLRYHYALGIAYGLNDRSTSGYDNE